MVILLDETDNFTDWHLQSIHLIHFNFVMNFKFTPKMTLWVRKTTNQEGNTPRTPNLQENNEKSLIDTIQRIVKENFKEHETKMSEMISNNL